MTTPAVPWSKPGKVTGGQGVNAMIFGDPGIGKTTLCADAAKTEHGHPLLVVNFDGDLTSIEDRDDLDVWPGENVNNGVIKSWDAFASFSAKLLSRQKLPHKTYMFDTISSAYNLAHKKSLRSGNPNRDPRQIFGEANDMMLDVFREWATASRERGVNVFFICHSEEKQDGENGPLKLRPTVTPGVIKGMYQAVSMIGALVPAPQNHRKLILHPTMKVVAKVHQPKTGPQLPLEIIDPDMARIVEHIKKVRSYPVPEKKRAAA